MLAGMDKNKGGRPTGNPSHDDRGLAAIGINYSQSSRWQRQASVPENEFEAWVSKTKAAEKELTAAALLKLAKQSAADETFCDDTIEGVCSDLDDLSGERRVRAIREHSSRKDILCRVVEADDLQARRMCAAENLQRDDLSAIETVGAIVEMLDAELIDADGYEELGGDPVERVKTLLTKLDSDYKHDTDYFGHKFMSKVESIFASLPRPTDWRSFFVNDLPLVTKVSPIVREIATREKLNKSQTKALEEVAQASPKTIKKVAKKSGDDATKLVIPAWEEVDGRELRDLSAKELRRAATNLKADHAAKAIKSRPVRAAKGQFDVIVMDPPWPMQKIPRDVRPNQAKALDYPTMSIDELRELWAFSTACSLRAPPAFARQPLLNPLTMSLSDPE